MDTSGGCGGRMEEKMEAGERMETEGRQRDKEENGRREMKMQGK